MLVDTIHRISDISAQLCMSISTPQNAILWLIYAIVPDIDYLPGEGDGIRAQNNQLSGTELGGKTMKTILKDVISCSTLRAKVRAAVAAIIIAVLERMISTAETWGGISAPDV